MDYLGGYFVNFGMKDAFSRTHIFCVVQDAKRGEFSTFRWYIFQEKVIIDNGNHILYPRQIKIGSDNHEQE